MNRLELAASLLSLHDAKVVQDKVQRRSLYEVTFTCISIMAGPGRAVPGYKMIVLAFGSSCRDHLPWHRCSLTQHFLVA